jgi:hypothetical protein
MQAPLTPTGQAEAPIPLETVSNGSNTNRIVEVRRKAAKRSLPFDLAAEELLVSQKDDNPARKKPRLEEPLSAATDHAARETATPDLSVGLSPPAADDDANADPVTDTQPNTRHLWTTDEDAKLTSAFASTSKKKWGKEVKPDWAAISALVSGRTKHQCLNRWKHVLDPNIFGATGRKGGWTSEEDDTLKDAAQAHGGKNWGAIAALVPGRTQKHCCNRWKNVLNPSIGRASGRKGQWSAIEDSKLKNAAQTHGGKNWGTIAGMVPGRTESQCLGRWHNVLDPNISRASGRKGKWSAAEDSQLKHTCQTHADKDWGAISLLVPGRTRKQCWSRWHDVLDPSIVRASGRKGQWSAAEDSQLKHAFQTHADKDWGAISLLVSGRTKQQCWNRWRYVDPTRRTVRENDRSTLKTALVLGQDPHSP